MEVHNNKYGITRKPNPPPFLVKTYMLVEDPSSDDVISWNADGTAFVVWQPAEFARDLLPTLFKHSNFSSFIRQLNTYGFRKVATSRWEFCNDLFHKGKREVLSQIRRRKAWANRPLPPVSPPPQQPPPHEAEVATAAATMSEVETERRSCSSSSSSEQQTVILSNLADENERLKKENGTLSSELSSMKIKCKELHDLVSLYSRPVAVPPGVAKEEKRSGDDVDGRPKLFGVRLDVNLGPKNGGLNKRKRSDNQVLIQSSSSSTTTTSTITTSTRVSNINIPQSCNY
ncbi:hypothetical protein V2J09_023952 [Rumex salicifolius]